MGVVWGEEEQKRIRMWEGRRMKRRRSRKGYVGGEEDKEEDERGKRWGEGGKRWGEGGRHMYMYVCNY